jgi:hypothetical protein
VDCLIAVGSQIKHLTKPWIDFEWRSFHQDILGGKKDKKIISYISGMDPLDLLRPLRFRTSIKHDPVDQEVSFRRLFEALR